MGNFFTDNDDLQFYFEKWIDWDPIIRITEKEYRDEDGHNSKEEALAFYREIANMVGEFAANEIAPYSAELDRGGVQYKDGEAVFPPRLAGIFKKIGDLELHSLSVPREFGGMNAPLMLYFINSELIGRADVSVMAHHGFHCGMAMAALVFSIHEGSTKFDRATGKILSTRFQKAIEEIAQGKAWGSMDITEPDAGSDMAALRTVGEQDAQGNWFVTGEKIFITSGHGKYHFVIARTEKPGDADDAFAGLEGLSMFLVPAYEEDAQGNRERIVALTRVDHKLGHHSSATCALQFERAPAFLIGKRGEGFQYMLKLMNNARIGVGFESLGLSECAWRLAKNYAAERSSMGKTIDRHEMIAEYLEQMRTETQAARAMVMAATYHEELGEKLRIALDYTDAATEPRPDLEKQKREHQRASRRLTPLLKYFAAEKAVEHARRCVQIHGGNGYMTEYGAEKLVRDALVMPIYEGTSQIQSLMAMKDTLTGIIKNPRRFFRRIAQARLRSLAPGDSLEKRVAQIQWQSLSIQQHLMTKTFGDKVKELRGVPLGQWQTQFKNWDPKRDFSYAMLHAERLTQILCDEVIAELLLEQSQKFPERAELLERHLKFAEPRVRYNYDMIVNSNPRILTELASRNTATGNVAAAAE